MSVYLIATIELKPGGMPSLVSAISEMIPILESAGWKLAHAFTQRTGQLGVVIDIWELPDFNAMNIGMGAVAQSPRFAQISAWLREAVQKETLVLADRLDYPVAGQPS
jgi:hypothetical protein